FTFPRSCSAASFTLYGATKIVASATRLLAHRPARFGGRVVEQATGQLASRLSGAGARVTAAWHEQVALQMLRTEDATAVPRGGGRSGVALAEGALEQPARRECAQSPPVAPAWPGEATATTWPGGYVMVAHSPAFYDSRTRLG